MLNKHFFKTVGLFTTLIALGLFLVFALGYLEESNNSNGVDTAIAK